MLVHHLNSLKISSLPPNLTKLPMFRTAILSVLARSDGRWLITMIVDPSFLSEFSVLAKAFSPSRLSSNLAHRAQLPWDFYKLPAPELGVGVGHQKAPDHSRQCLCRSPLATEG